MTSPGASFATLRLPALPHLRPPVLSIRAILLLIIGALTLMVGFFSVTELGANALRLSRSYELRDAIAMSDQFFNATEKVSVERDLALAMLQADDPATIADLQPLLAESRSAVDQAMVETLEEFDSYTLPALADLRRNLEARENTIRALRPEIDAALRLPLRERDATIVADWEQAATELMTGTETLWIGFIRPFTDIDPVVTQHLRYRHTLRTITDYTGRERSIIGQILSENAAPTAEQTIALLRGEGVLEMSWRTARLLAEQSNLFPAVAPQFSDAESHYATLHDMSREMFYAPDADRGGFYLIGPDLWFELSSQAAESLTELRTASRAAMKENLDRMIGATERAIAWQIIIFLVALGLCLYCFWVIAVRVIAPINQIVDALMRAARGEKADFAPRSHHDDEIGKLVVVLQALERNVEETRRNAAKLDISARALEAEIGVRRLAEERTQAQLERLALLHQISRAIGERQDLSSIFQVAVRSVEDQLPADFACLCLYDHVEHRLRVARIGVKGLPFAEAMALLENAEIEVGANGLARCMRGRLVYEPDVAALDFPFPQRLAGAGLRSVVAAPLQVESQVFGALLVARAESNGFSSGECEFLRQLSEHVALAAHQAQLNAALRAAYDELRQTQDAVMQQERLRALGQMASGIAHDINNALSPITLYTESLLETEASLSPAGRGKLEIVQRAIDDAARTVARMGEFYRRRDTQLTLQPIQAEMVLQHVLDLTQARWRDLPQQRGHVYEVNTEFAPDLPLILGVESELREALTNLVFNAIDAMPNGGAIILRTKAVDGKVAIEIADTGIGMDEETRRRCLEPFFTTKGERGTGLGLAMVYGVVQRHNGDITIESEPGKGTLFRLTFAPAAGAVAAATLEPLAPISRLRLLIVDDDPILLRTLRDVLEGDGHVVASASDGAGGIAAFAEAQVSNKRFDAVITDLGMPRIDGRQVAEAVKRASPATPVLLLTGWGERLKAEDETPPHVDYVLSKPPKLRDLRIALAQCCADERRATAG